jgi:hypothetical protein
MLLESPGVITIDRPNTIDSNECCLNAEGKIVQVVNKVETDCHFFSAKPAGDGFSSRIWAADDTPCGLDKDKVFTCSKSFNISSETYSVCSYACVYLKLTDFLPKQTEAYLGVYITPTSTWSEDFYSERLYTQPFGDPIPMHYGEPDDNYKRLVPNWYSYFVPPQ